jgi:hypothetical protein
MLDSQGAIVVIMKYTKVSVLIVVAFGCLIKDRKYFASILGHIVDDTTRIYDENRSILNLDCPSCIHFAFLDCRTHNSLGT